MILSLFAALAATPTDADARLEALEAARSTATATAPRRGLTKRQQRKTEARLAALQAARVAPPTGETAPRGELTKRQQRRTEARVAALQAARAAEDEARVDALRDEAGAAEAP